MDDRPRVLIVDGGEAITGLISTHLQSNGFAPAWASDAAAAQREVDRVMPDVVILDWWLAGESGYSLLKRWRYSARTRLLPVLMLSARSEEAEMVAALDAGADDYITKPLSARELTARIRAVLRRLSPVPGQGGLAIGDLVLDPATHRVSHRGQALQLGPIEFRLLRFLMENPDEVHSRRELLDGVCAAQLPMRERAADVHVMRLRSALGEAARLLETVKGSGYRLSGLR